MKIHNADDQLDVFISYKRKTAAAEARLIRADLTGRGLRVFMDVTDLSSGRFDESLLTSIARTRNFVVILGPRALDHCADPDDWLRKEIRQAVQADCNLVPVLLPGFKFPKDLPGDIAILPRYQSVEYSHVFFDATMERLAGMLQTPDGRPLKTKAEARRGRRPLRRWAAAAALVLIAAAATAIVYRANLPQARLKRAIASLRSDFAAAMSKPPDSRQLAIAAAQADIDAIRHIDPHNGTAFYYAGEIKRLGNATLFTASCINPAAFKAQPAPLDAYEDDFYHYLDTEAGLPASQAGGDLSVDLCYSRLSGHCPQRTAWIEHLLANDLYQKALLLNDRAARNNALERAQIFARAAARTYQDRNHNPGFVQCIDTETLIAAIQGNLSSSGN